MAKCLCEEDIGYIVGIAKFKQATHGRMMVHGQKDAPLFATQYFNLIAVISQSILVNAVVCFKEPFELEVSWEFSGRR